MAKTPRRKPNDEETPDVEPTDTDTEDEPNGGEDQPTDRPTKDLHIFPPAKGNSGLDIVV